jgi:hypothetical protein
MSILQIYRNGEAHISANEASRAVDKADRATEQIKALQRQTEALALTCQALWEILREKTSLTEGMILEKMEEIDVRDGKKDGKITEQVVACPSCNRNSNSKRSSCLYCGSALPSANLFGRSN